MNNQTISINAEIYNALQNGAVVAMAVSGGKDSSIMALETNAYLDSIGHTGKRVLIHSDLGSVEWKDSLPVCEKLAERLGLELIVVKRKSGGMMQRWQTRWANNVARYAALECVKMILPWSTPSMRFCTSELKTAVICRELTSRFAGQTILNVTGIRRAESAGRASAPISKPNTALVRAAGTTGYDWNSIVEMETEEIFLAHRRHGFALHEAYTTYGASRVSCAYCIMSSQADLLAAAGCADNHAIYREMCELEITAAFSFQSGSWLSDVAPHLLTADQLCRLARAKQIVGERAAIEKRIPKHLLFVKGVPQAVPTLAEAQLLCDVRRQIAALQNITVDFVQPAAVVARYKELRRQAAAKK